MHAVLVTHENDTPADQAKRHPENIGFAKELTKVPGLVMKTWINDRATYGGFYVFTDKAAAESFINEEMFQSAVPKDPSNRNVQIKYFDVFPELSAMTGTSSKPLRGK